MSKRCLLNAFHDIHHRAADVKQMRVIAFARPPHEQNVAIRFDNVFAPLLSSCGVLLQTFELIVKYGLGNAVVIAIETFKRNQFSKRVGQRRQLVVG